MTARMNLKRLIQSVAKNFSDAEEIFSSRKVTEAAEIFYRLRYVLGGIFFLLCVLFEIHGSSIGMYGRFLDHPELQSIIAGVPRQIRFDEYVHDLGQAVRHPAMIFRPALIGYLF